MTSSVSHASPAVSAGVSVRDNGPGESGARRLRALPASASSCPRDVQGLPLLLPIGLAEAYYTRIAEEADEAHDRPLRDAAKVGQYVTLALHSHMGWDQKRRLLDHVLRRHCRAPSYAENAEWHFYRRIGDFVREHAGNEALRLASREDDLYAARVEMGHSRDAIAADAETFFGKLLCCGDDCPPWFAEEDWRQLRVLRDQWV